MWKTGGILESAYLWKVTAKRAVGSKLPAGAWVEIVKNGTSSPPNQRERLHKPLKANMELRSQMEHLRLALGYHGDGEIDTFFQFPFVE